jgi:REP element-mobilizing transposase RayT/predicted DNA-binding protein (UPF0251 family)
MARPLRVEFPGAIYHVTSRGNAREDIFLDDTDRRQLLDVLAKVVSRFHWACHAWCLMPNHYHLVIETPEANLALGMRQLNGVYTQRFNRRHKRVGHVFQGRYKAIVVDRDAYLLELCRYVVLNPVRAGLVDEAQEWPWSSYRATVGLAPTIVPLYTDWLLSQFRSSRKTAIKRYIRFVSDGMSGGKSVWKHLRQQIYLGDDAFVERIKLKFVRSGPLTEVPRAQWKPSGKSLEEYAAASMDRHEAMARAYLEGGYRMNEIAARFGVHYATVSRAVKKYEGGNV